MLIILNGNNTALLFEETMSVISVYIINKAGGLIFSHDQPIHSSEVEASFAYPIGGLVLEEVDRNVMVKFGEQQGIQGTGERGLMAQLPKVQEREGLWPIPYPAAQGTGEGAYTVPCCLHSMYGTEGTTYFRVLYRGGCAVTNEAYEIDTQLVCVVRFGRIYFATPES